MATSVFKEEEVELANGDKVKVRPLTIKPLRRFMDTIQKLDTADDQATSIDIMVDACEIALEKAAPELAANRDELEEALDVPTMWKILEIAGGVKLGGPNLTAGRPGRI